MKFDKKDIEPLDFIINQCLIKDIVTTDNLLEEKFIPYLKGGLLEYDLKYNPVDEFVRYLNIINEYDACECSFRADAEFARKNKNTLHFQRQGGFKKIHSEIKAKSKISEQKNTLEIKNLELQKENLEYQKSLRDKEEQIRDLTKDNLRLNNWDVRLRWLIAIITFIIGFVTKYFIDR